MPDVLPRAPPSSSHLPRARLKRFVVSLGGREVVVGGIVMREHPEEASGGDMPCSATGIATALPFRLAVRA